MTSDYVKSLKEYNLLSEIRFERFYRNWALGLACREEIKNACVKELCQNGCVVINEIDLAKLRETPYSLFADKESHYLLWLCYCIKYQGKSLLAWMNEYIDNLSNIIRGGINTYKRNGWSVHVLYVYQLVNYNFAHNVMPVAVNWDFDAKRVIVFFRNEYGMLSDTAKFVLKIACFIHDIGAQIAVNDHELLGVSLVEENYAKLKITDRDLVNENVLLSQSELINILQMIVGNHQLINQVAAEVSDYIIYEKVNEIKNKSSSERIKRFIAEEFVRVMYLLGAADMMAVDDLLLSAIKFEEMSEAKEYIQKIITDNDYVRDYKKYGMRRLKCFVNDRLKEASDEIIRGLVDKNDCNYDELLRFMYEVQEISYGIAAIKPLNDLPLTIAFISALYRMVIKYTANYKNILIKIDSGFSEKYIRHLFSEAAEEIDRNLDYKIRKETFGYIFTVRLA